MYLQQMEKAYIGFVNDGYQRNINKKNILNLLFAHVAIMNMNMPTSNIGLT